MASSMPFGLKIAIINRAFRKKMDEKAAKMGLTSVQLRVLGSAPGNDKTYSETREERFYQLRSKQHRQKI